jgi:hypothetical protein
VRAQYYHAGLVSPERIRFPSHKAGDDLNRAALPAEIGVMRSSSWRRHSTVSSKPSIEGGSSITRSISAVNGHSPRFKYKATLGIAIPSTPFTTPASPPDTSRAFGVESGRFHAEGDQTFTALERWAFLTYVERNQAFVPN